MVIDVNELSRIWGNVTVLSIFQFFQIFHVEEDVISRFSGDGGGGGGRDSSRGSSSPKREWILGIFYCYFVFFLGH